MKRVLRLVFLLLMTVFPARAALLLQPDDRVALCGDDLSDSRCSLYLEDYLMLAEPALRGIDIERLGWLGGDPAAIQSKIAAGLLPFKPTVVVISCHAGDMATREKTQADLIEALKKADVRRIVIGSPVCVDSVVFQNDPTKAAAENNRRAALAEIDRQIAAKEGAVYADVFGVTQAAMLKAKAMRGDNYALERDERDTFELAMASAYLKALGCAGSVGSITVDFAADRAEGSPGQKIVSCQNHKLLVESTRYPFWFPGHGVGAKDPPPWPSLQFLTFNDDLNRYILRVKNLPTAQTKVYWGDLNRDFASDELAKGVNLSAEMPAWNPFGRITSSVDNGVGGQQEKERIAGNAASRGTPDPQAATNHAAMLQVVRNRLVPVQIKMSFQPLQAVEKQPPGPIPVILDTDLDGDVDDVGALALLNDFMDQGEATLLAVVHNTVNTDQSSCATIQAIDTWYGHPTIPIGQYLGEHPQAKLTSVIESAPPGRGAYHDPATTSGSHYTLAIHQRFDPEFPNDNQMPAGVDVYRRALAAATDGSVVIVSVGLMENIQDLIQSQPDAVSPLGGLDLVRKKVREMVIMANTQPADLYLLNKWPTKILWTCDVGSFIGTGPSLLATPENNPVRVAYDLFGVLHTGRQSWDLTASWLAVRGPGDLFDVIAGRPQYIRDIIHDPIADHPNESVVTIKMPYPDVAQIIGVELARPPKK